MIAFLSRLFAGQEPIVARAEPEQAAQLAALHAAAFRRGWSESEFEALLLDRAVLAQAARSGPNVIGFIMSRLAAHEAEILSLTVAAAYRGRGIAGQLLDRHLELLQARGVQTVFLEVDENNTAARRLYFRRAFQKSGQRQGYYANLAGRPGMALILRYDFPRQPAERDGDG